MRPIVYHIVTILLFILLGYVSYLLLQLTLPYLAFRPNIDFLLTKQLVYHKLIWRLGFYVHIFSSTLLILCGAFQFNRFIQDKAPRFHRINGKIYISIVLFLSGPSAFILATEANGGIAAKISFILLTLLWIYCTLMGFLSIKKKHIQQHVNWLWRSYALTLSAVTLRFYAFSLDFLNIDIHPVDAYILISWVSWVPNLLFAEFLIRINVTRRLFID